MQLLVLLYDQDRRAAARERSGRSEVGRLSTSQLKQSPVQKVPGSENDVPPTEANSFQSF